MDDIHLNVTRDQKVVAKAFCLDAIGAITRTGFSPAGHHDEDPDMARIPALTQTGRRSILRAGLLGVGVAAFGGTQTFLSGAAEATTQARKPIRKKPPVKAKPKPKPKPPPAPTGPEAATIHLLRRATYGITPELLADVKAAGGPTQWLNQQLDPGSIHDNTSDAVLARFPLAGVDPPKVWASGEQGHWDSMFQLSVSTMTRAVWSKRQLFEVMVEFWSNHLNITCPSSEVWATKAWDDVHVIRANAFGRFEDMLLASANSPAMLLYLNNADSTGTDPNENYGRELLELHTVGVDAGYTHEDVRSAAFVMSGRTVWNPWNGGTPAIYGTSTFESNDHYVGPVSVLGWSHANASKEKGMEVGDSLIRYLARHPMTAKRIARKLAVRFVADAPPQSLIDQLAAVYLAHDTAIVPVLKTLFASPEFAAGIGKKFRRPYEDTIASLRAVGVTPDTSSTSTEGLEGMRWVLEEMGHAPLGWGLPNGYSDLARAWTGAGTTLQRWNMHVGVTQQWWRGGVTYPDLAKRLLPAGAASRGALIDGLFASLLPGQKVSANHRTTMLTFLGGDGRINNDQGDTTWLLPITVALVLDSPYWSVR